MDHPTSRVSRRQFVQGASVAGLGLLGGCGRLWGNRSSALNAPRIGVLASGAPEPQHEMLRQGLRDAGYVEGQNLAMEWRVLGGGGGRPSRTAGRGGWGPPGRALSRG